MTTRGAAFTLTTVGINEHPEIRIVVAICLNVRRKSKECRMLNEPPEIMASASTGVARSFWKLGGLTPWQLCRTVFEQIIDNNVFGRAAELAFYFLFALFP